MKTIKNQRPLRVGVIGIGRGSSFTGDAAKAAGFELVAMSIVGIQAYRSALADGVTVAVPDLRKESVRKQYEKDDWTSDPARRRKGQP